MSPYLVVMPAVRRLPLVALLVGSLLLGACTGDSKDDAPPAPTAAPGTPLASYSTEGLSAARADFCRVIPTTAAENALGARAIDSSSYGNGDPARLAKGVKDVSHEYACTYRARGSTARSWVFAPPVTRARARQLVREARTAPGCMVPPDSPRFGAPSTATFCRRGNQVTAAYQGLFVDAWLTCSLTVPAARADRAELLARTGRWCVDVAKAATS